MPAVITRSELVQELALDAVTVVETLGEMYYADGHLPGAINIPHTRVRELAPALLADLGAPIVTYCSNTACQNSDIAAHELRALGYTNVRRYVEGKQDWTEAGLPLEPAAVPVGR